METGQLPTEILTQLQEQACGNDSEFIPPQKGDQAPKGHGVLIVDDSKLLRLRLAVTVESLGYSIVGFADDGLIGIKMALDLKPRVIILDHEMPQLNGLQCLQAIMQRCPYINTIVCSAKITESLIVEYTQLGVIEILTKPVQHDLLARAMKEAMEEALA